MKKLDQISKLVVFLIFAISYVKASAQETPTILLEERFPINQDHPYFETFKQEEAKRGIAYIYYANLSCAENSRQERGGPLVTNKRDENSLIFTLQYDNRVVYDTLQNCVHLKGAEEMGLFGSIRNWATSLFTSDWNHNKNFHTIKGKLPPVVKQTWVEQRDRQIATPIGIELLEEAMVRIDIKTLDNQLVTTVHQARLSKGIHEFTWVHHNVSKGYYLLEYTVDGASRRQEIRVKN